MAVFLAISEIFSVKEWPELEIWVWGCKYSSILYYFRDKVRYWSKIAVFHTCDVYVGGKVRVAKFMIFLDLQHRGSK